MVPAVAPRVEVGVDLATVAGRLARRVETLALESLERRGRFGLALSGGSTPEALFRSLAGDRSSGVDWTAVDFFWADERAVPPSDPRSNYGLAARTWLEPRAIPPIRVHRISGESDSLEAASGAYERDLQNYLGSGPESGGPALLDLAILGIGPDGHTASLFPDSPLLESSAWTGVERSPPLDPRVPRISLTPAALNRSRIVAFLAAGDEKRWAVARVLHPDAFGVRPPAARVRGLESTEWFVDRAAGGSPAGGTGAGRPSDG
ncbi:MAG TPA: 6-phosphogluconolactonase [Thermoplasmata archaeon]|nr:6-phosphogluconolactonase [Thermoplasmata archaeon]